MIEDRKSHPIWNHDEVIQNNIIAFNRDAQVWGWFDVKDSRHWPASAESKELTLEKLYLRFERNVYFALPNQGLFNWGPSWSRHETFPTLSVFHEIMRIDFESETVDPRFADVSRLDFRISKPTRTARLSYPRGPVPDVTLGIPIE